MTEIEDDVAQLNRDLTDIGTIYEANLKTSPVPGNGVFTDDLTVPSGTYVISFPLPYSTQMGALLSDVTHNTSLAGATGSSGNGYGVITYIGQFNEQTTLRIINGSGNACTFTDNLGSKLRAIKLK